MDCVNRLRTRTREGGALVKAINTFGFHKMRENSSPDERLSVSHEESYDFLLARKQIVNTQLFFRPDWAESKSTRLPLQRNYQWTAGEGQVSRCFNRRVRAPSVQLSKDIAGDQYSSRPAWCKEGAVTPGDLKPLRSRESEGPVVQQGVQVSQQGGEGWKLKLQDLGTISDGSAS